MATGERWVACCSKAETEVTRIAAKTKIPALVVTVPVRVPHPEVRRCGRSANMAVGLAVAMSRGASCFDPADFLGYLVAMSLFERVVRTNFLCLCSP